MIATLIGAAGPARVPGPYRGPLGATAAFAAAPQEDCDLDGYDDHTGAPLPWAGFDATRGDTIPSGWDGVANSWSGERTNDGSSSAGSSGGASSGGGTSSGGTKGTSGSGASGAGGGTSATGGRSSVVVSGSGSTAPAANPSAGVPVAASSVTVPDTATVLAARGIIHVSDSQGALMHLGGRVRIQGEGFAPLATGLRLWINTPNASLGTVTTDADGRFSVVVDVPAVLAVGSHRIGISIGESHLAHAAITVGPRPADTFVKALLVGFDDANPERDAGIGTLAALSLAGLVAYGTRLVWRRAPVRAS